MKKSDNYLDNYRLRAHPPHTINEAISVIEALTGIRRSPTQIRVFLKQL